MSETPVHLFLSSCPSYLYTYAVHCLLARYVIRARRANREKKEKERRNRVLYLLGLSRSTSPLSFPFWSSPQSRTTLGSTYARAARTPIQSYSGLGQVRRERQRVVSWSLVPRSGYGILTPSSGVWQAMVGSIDVSATSHPRQSAPLFTTRPPPPSFSANPSTTLLRLSSTQPSDSPSHSTTSRCPHPPTHRTKSRSCLLLPSLFTMAMRYPHYTEVVLHVWTKSRRSVPTNLFFLFSPFPPRRLARARARYYFVSLFHSTF